MEEKLVGLLRGLSPAAVAFSGGVDSAVLAKAAVLAAERFGTVPPRAVFAFSSSSTGTDIEAAHRGAAEIGIELTEFESREMEIPEFLQNGRDRCYYCKRHRFSEMRNLIAGWDKPAGFDWHLLDGENADDRTAWRPGRRAAEELGVRSPIAELGISKEGVRGLARRWGLSSAERPSTPCLVTRLIYGLAPEEHLLRMVETGEAILRSLAFSTCRVRVDAPERARIEVPKSEISRVLEAGVREHILAEFQKIGWLSVSIDLDGFVSGKYDISAVRND